MAKEAAEKVEKTGQAEMLEPMSNSERRIVHEALQGHAAVESYSKGERAGRHVVICLRGSAPPQEARRFKGPGRRSALAQEGAHEGQQVPAAS